MLINQHSASFRDPDGFIFRRENILYRAIAPSYEEDYQQLMQTGLYTELISKGWLVPHVDADFEAPFGYARVIKPEQLPFISYSYEWSFGQLRDAALLTLDILLCALKYNMTLKDASMFNVTYHQGKPIFLDTLSFIKVIPGSPWAGYGQFCSHFLAPLALMCKTDIRLQKLLQTYIEGIPLDLASSLLPASTWLKFNYLIHIHLHAKAQKKHAGTTSKVKVNVSNTARKNLLESLRIFVKSLKPSAVVTEWGDYYNDTNYSPEQFEEKKSIIAQWIQSLQPKTVYDLGANDGTFSRVAAQTVPLVIAADIDPVAVQHNYELIKKENEIRILPMLQDLTQPSPALGWALEERESFITRAQVDLGMALALVHHLAIGNNTPLNKVFSLFAKLAPVWIVEFPNKDDSQVKRLLLNRPDIFPNYTEEGFEAALSDIFAIKQKHHIAGTQRVLYLLSRKDNVL